MKLRSSTLFVCAASFGILVAVAAGLAAIGTPASIRLQRLDNSRSQNLQNIVFAIRTYHRTHGALPDQLERVQDDGSFFNFRFKDAETGSPYEYRILDASTYELCAQFATVSDETTAPFGNSMFWKHPQGRHCFTVQATGTGSESGVGGVFKQGFIPSR